MTNVVCLVNSQPQKIGRKYLFYALRSNHSLGWSSFLRQSFQMHVHNASATNKRRMGGKKPHAQDVEFEVNLCDVYAMTLALSS